MKRLNVYVTEQQDAFLKETGQQLGIKPSELLRRIVDEYRLKAANETQPQNRNKAK